jgi:predicted ArsR family transcriptional regulator
MMESPAPAPESLDIGLERDIFLRGILRHLSGALQDVVGLEEGAGFVSLVGQQVGEDLNRRYVRAIGVERLDRGQVARVLVDLKRRIQGDFYVIEETEDRIVLGNRACPFGEFVADRPSLCMMTSNVFGRVVAENLGYGRVVLEETIARGAPGCRITIHLTPSGDSAPGDPGREYFRS